MISYKTWKILQENLGQTNLGVKSPNIVGKTGSPLFGMMKKKKGFPGSEEGPPDMGDDASDSGDDMGDEDHDMDDMGDEDGDEDHDMDDMGDEDGDEDDMGDEDGDEDMDDEDGDEDMDDEDGDEDMGGGDMGGGDMSGDMGGGDMSGDMGGPPKKKFGMPMGKPPMSKSPMGKPPMKMSYMKKESKDTVNARNKKKKCCSTCSKMKTEDNEFLANLRSMTGGTKFAIDDEGYWVPIDEDALIAPDQTDNEPRPGEIGYAPVQKVATNFQEWATKHVKKTRK